MSQRRKWWRLSHFQNPGLSSQVAETLPGDRGIISFEEKAENIFQGGISQGPLAQPPLRLLSGKFVIRRPIAYEARPPQLAERTVTLGEKTSFHLWWGDRKAHRQPWAPVGMLAEAPQILEKAGCYWKCWRGVPILEESEASNRIQGPHLRFWFSLWLVQQSQNSDPQLNTTNQCVLLEFESLTMVRPYFFLRILLLWFTHLYHLLG